MSGIAKVVKCGILGYFSGIFPTGLFFYYGFKLSLLIFNLEKDGKVYTVEMPANRATLKKAAKTY
jgi:hypothetical protein